MCHQSPVSHISRVWMESGEWPPGRGPSEVAVSRMTTPGSRFVFMAASVSSVMALGSFSSDLKKSSECIRGTAGTAQPPEHFLKRGSPASPPKRERFVRTYASSSPPTERGRRVHSPCHGVGHGIPDFPWASVEEGLWPSAQEIFQIGRWK